MEAELVRGIPFYGIPCERLRRSLSLSNLRIPFAVMRGVREAREILEEEKPDFVFSKGGFVAFPVCVAASMLKIPLFLHESDLTAGLVNRLTARYARLCFTAFRETAERLPRGVWVGTPIRESATVQGRKKRGFSKRKPTVLVMGGSSGAARLNALTVSALPLLEDFRVLHITGRGKGSLRAGRGYYPYEFVQDMGALYAEADVAVSRAGSNALAELMCAGVPTLAVPLPSGRGDQKQNAAYYAALGAIRTVPEEELTEKKLLEEVRLLKDGAADFRRAMQDVCRLKSAARIADEIIREIGCL